MELTYFRTMRVVPEQEVFDDSRYGFSRRLVDDLSPDCDTALQGEVDAAGSGAVPGGTSVPAPR